MLKKLPGGMALYLQLEEELRQDLLKLRYGEKIPSENEMMQQYQVSRGTVRQALDHLVSEGYLYRQAGKGTFRGSSPDRAAAHNLTSFTARALQKGEIPYVSDVQVIEGTADEKTASLLAVPVGEPIWLLSRYRGVQGCAPCRYSVAYLPKTVFPVLCAADLELSLFDMIAGRFDIHTASAQYRIYAALPEQVGDIDLPPDRAVLVTEYIGRKISGEPFFLDVSYDWSGSCCYEIEQIY